MEKEIYIIWNTKEDRPSLMANNYGGMVVYLTMEQAQAYLINYDSDRKQDYIIRNFVIS